MGERDSRVVWQRENGCNHFRCVAKRHPGWGPPYGRQVTCLFEKAADNGRDAMHELQWGSCQSAEMPSEFWWDVVAALERKP